MGMPEEKNLKRAPEGTFIQYAAQSIQQTASEFKTDLTNGLTTAQATQAHKEFGPNTITGHEVTAWHIFFNQIKSPFIYLLLIIALINFILGESLDGLMILFLVAINTIFSFFQEYRSHHSLQLLQKYIVDTIRIIRDGKEVEVTTDQLVPGDIIKLYPGDKIPADVRLTSTENLTIDESILTGESAPVQKDAKPIENKNITIFNASNIGFSGTTILNGRGIGIVFATGNSSHFGSIATSAKDAPKLSSFTKGIAQFSRFILYLVVITVACVFIAHLLLNPQKFDAISLLIFSMALGVSIIPEALPIVITASLSRGALHLAKHKLVAKRLSAIEDLGSMEILCTDKTGTITQNSLSLAAIKSSNERQTLIYGLLASGLPVSALAKDQGFNGPIWQKLTLPERASLEHYTVVAEHPFDPLLRYSSVLAKNDDQYILLLRGNVQEVINRCANLDAAHKEEITAWSSKEGSLGRRVLAFAKKELAKPLTTITQNDETDLEYLGLISYEDPLKPTALDALTRAHNLGVEVKIISGDTQEVNYAIAKSINLVTNKDQMISGEELAQKNDADKEKAIEQCTVFAHIVPNQKVQIIQTLEEKYDVGYLGDGINDAPALKIAHVSMAVDTAADIARDVADIILLHKSLRVIVNGIHEGRIIVANMVKYIKSTLAPNFGHFYSLAIASLLIDFLPMLPVQLLLVSLITDFPLIAISTDTVSFADINKPQKYDFKDIALVTMILGLVVMVADFIIFSLFYRAQPAILQTNWFVTSVLVEISFFYSIRTTLPFYKAPRPSWIVASLSAMVAIITLALPFTAFGQKFLHFTPLSANNLLLIGIIVACYFIITDLVKVLFYRIYKSNG